MARYRRGNAGFTLVELLVVIGIIALLMGILLPVLAKARESGNTVKCAANLRAIGQGIAIYLSEYRQTFPAAYQYKPNPANAEPIEPANPTFGYVHWSHYIYGDPAKGRAPADAFKCPSLNNGGLPPSNPAEADRDGGQQNDPDSGPGVVDDQVGRCAYTVNEAIMPRNKFHGDVRGTSPNGFHSRFVRAGQIKRNAETILGTEFWENWRIVSGFTGEPGETPAVKSHRPVHGFIGIPSSLNISEVPRGLGNNPQFRRVTSVPAWVESGQAQSSRLEWVGRNHGKKGKAPKTNFLYVDGHVETKTIEETLQPFQWGERIYSAHPQPRIAS